MNTLTDYVKAIIAVAIIIWLPASWVTHIIECFNNGEWGFLIAGAIFFPVAWAHGTWVWFT